MTKRLLTALSFVLLLFCSTNTSAQTAKQTKNIENLTSWYVGVKGGMPFGISTFSSFGADKTHAGWNFGLYGAYNINSIFSVELSASFGNIGMSKFCNDNYWLGSDGNRYSVPVSGMSGYHYSSLYSSVSMQNYGLKFNIDILQLFPQTSNSRWMLQASPIVSTVVTNATIKQISNDSKVMDGATNIHFGIGGDLSIGYRITEKLNAHVYSGVTYLTGSQFDGMPEYKHRNNIIWESGIKLSWSFGKKKKARKSHIHTTPATVIIPATPIVKKEQAVVVDQAKSEEQIKPMEQAKVEQAKIEQVRVEQVKVEPEIDSVVVVKDEIITSIYFEQNQTFLSVSEFEKLDALFELMQSDPKLIIVITGWTNIIGKTKANLRVSHSRAQNVGWWLTERGIPYSRIKMNGKGIDLTTEDLDQARRVDITNQLK